MSVKTLESYQEFTATGSSADFLFNFNYVDSSEIVVGMRTGDNQYIVVDPVNYVLTQNASTDGGKIRFVTTKPCENPDDPTCGDYIDNPPPAGTIVRIERKTVRSSTADWYVGLDMNSLVGLFDKLFRISQENSDKFKNTIQTFPTQQGITVRELLSEHDKKIFYWNNEKQWLDITDFTIDDVVRQTDVGDILEQANAYSDEQNAVLENRIDGKLTAVNAQIDANADAIQKTREDFASADQAIRDDMNAEDSRLQTQITAHANAITTNKNDIDELGDDVAEIQAKIPESASGSNPLVTKQQLLDEEMDIRDDLNESVSELQTQITAQAAEIATKQDQLTAGDNIIISGNIISATGAGGGVGFDVIVVQELPESGEKGIIYLVPKDSAAPDVYDEYVWVTTTSTFELIGSTRVDLTGYVKNKDYATGSTGGVIKPYPDLYATNVTTGGFLYCKVKSLDSYKADNSNMFIAKGTLENIKNDFVKRAVTENDIELTTAEQTSARTWLGAVGKTDYANSSTGGVFKTYAGLYATAMNSNGFLYCQAKSLDSYKADNSNMFIAKGTLDNVLTQYAKDDSVGLIIRRL